jgi:hypothetical protein
MFVYVCVCVILQVVGPRYINDDFQIGAVDHLGKHASGVLG